MGDATAKALSSGGAGTMVILIGILLALYILLIPPQDRWNLLNNNSIQTPDESLIVLHEYPGLLSRDTNEKTISLLPLSLESPNTPKELLRLNSLIISHSIFVNNNHRIVFNTNGLKPHDLYLSFNVEKHKGKMRIVLNNNVIAEQEFNGNKPIQLPNQYLTTGENILYLEAMSPGLAFWRNNYYYLKDIAIVGTLIDESIGVGERSFYLGDKELRNIDSAKLRFFTGCKNPAKVELLLNNELIANTLMPCSKSFSFDLNLESLRKGKNVLRVKSSDEILLDNLRIVIDYKERQGVNYYFEVNDLNSSYELILRFGDTEKKRLRIRINDYEKSIATYSDEYHLDITDFVEEGINELELTPLDEVDVKELLIVKK